MSVNVTHTARIAEIQRHSPGVLSAVLHPATGDALPPFTPGAHIELHLAPGLRRSYSLSGDALIDGEYRVTVLRDANSQGGSAYIFDHWEAGQTLRIGAPRNGFPLAEGDSASVFIAGGIGITPFLPMMAQCNRQHRPWELHFSARRFADAPLLDEVRRLAGNPWGTLVLHFGDVPGQTRLDLVQLVHGLTAGTHVYCCGPQRMLMAFREASRGMPAALVHMESFDSGAVLATGGNYVVHLQRSGLDIQVLPGQTILQAARLRGVEVPASCEQGACGACETRVLEGLPDHRDVLLSERERRAGKTMMICCSGALSARLVLDL